MRVCFCQSSKAASFLSLPAVNTPSSATCLHTAVSGCSPMLGDFWDLSQGHCLYVLPNGSARPVNVQVNEAAVVLKFSDGLSEQDTGMRCCCRGKRPDESKVTKELKIPDLLGVVLDPEKALLRFVHCPRRSSVRVREDVILQIQGDSEVLKQTDKWAKELSSKCHSMKGPRKYRVFINPASGSGQAQVKWEIAKELLDQLPWIQLEELRTTHAGQAEEVAEKEVNPESCDGIIVVSGDGMVHEVFNGLSKRPDAEAALRKLPVGHIPGGSGNALATSINHSAGESFGALEAAFLIAKGKTQPLDLMTVSQPSRPLRTSFLSLSGAIISDIDLGSESMRFLGGLRFAVYGVYCLLNPKPLQAELTYWPATASTVPGSSPPPIEEALPEGPWVTITDSFNVFWAINMAWASFDSHLAPGLSMGSGTWKLALLRNASRATLTKFLLNLENGGHVNLEKAELLECKAFRLLPQGSSGSRERFSLDGEEVPFEGIQLWPSLGGHVLGAQPFIQRENSPHCWTANTSVVPGSGTRLSMFSERTRSL
ncbi:unnamed protein product [Durusdinium trenchii]|uniref:DAGKc domain-containing protein n=1 Tax=Durusdinium trenchii TaxID=1381693 RepID=A0ABP0LCI1_9DINO